MPALASRRDFLRTSAIITGLSFVPRGLRAAGESATDTISILHTTDLHGNILPTSSYDGVEDLGGLARCAAQLRAWREANPHSLTVDAGDVYQGTQVGLSTRGRVMIEAFNELDYDAWVLGNHDFDWGLPALETAIDQSHMPVLAANATIAGRPVQPGNKRTGLDGLQPFVIRDVHGYRIALIGITTPGIPYWLHPKMTGLFQPLDPVPPVHRAVEEAKRQGADAIVLIGHMGHRSPFDDFANRVNSIGAAFPDAAVYIGGHTHRDQASERVNGLPYTQANYFGIHCGKVDLQFDRETRQLQRVQPMLAHMTPGMPLDPAVLSLAADDLEAADTLLATVVGRFRTTFSTEQPEGQPSMVENLIGSAIAGMLENQRQVDGVWHGLFSEEPLVAGPVHIADLWKVIPYENQVVTARLTPEQLRLLVEEGWFASRRSSRSLIGFQVRSDGQDERKRVSEIRHANGEPLDPNRRYTIAFNSYDAVSGGQRMLRLRTLLGEPESRAQFHDKQTRTALINFIRSRGEVGLEDLRWS